MISTITCSNHCSPVFFAVCRERPHLTPAARCSGAGLSHCTPPCTCLTVLGNPRRWEDEACLTRPGRNLHTSPCCSLHRQRLDDAQVSGYFCQPSPPTRPQGSSPESSGGWEEAGSRLAGIWLLRGRSGRDVSLGVF